MQCSSSGSPARSPACPPRYVRPRACVPSSSLHNISHQAFPAASNHPAHTLIMWQVRSALPETQLHTVLCPAVFLPQAHQVVTDLAAATLSMLSQRPPAHEAVATAGAIPALLQLLDPLQSSCAVENAAKALGNLSADAACRALIRSSGGVGSLSRLLRNDCSASMQVHNSCLRPFRLSVRQPIACGRKHRCGRLVFPLKPPCTLPAVLGCVPLLAGCLCCGPVPPGGTRPCSV